MGAEHLWTANVFGTESSPSDGILDSRGWAAWYPASHLRLGAAGRLVRFLANPVLNHGYVMGGAEGRWRPGSRQLLSAGASGAWRINGDLYAPYDYRQLSLFAEAKHYFNPSCTGQLRADLSTRAYPESPQEDARKLKLGAWVNRSLPTRTSLSLGAGVGWKQYLKASAESPSGAGTAQSRSVMWEAALRGAQGLSGRLALRAWYERSGLVEVVDVTTQLAGFENPLLDEFSAEGYRLGAAVKAILPWNFRADLSGERARLDYPGRPPAVYDPDLDRFLLDSDGLIVLSAGERRDTATHVGLAVERQAILAGGISRLTIRAGVQWTRQDSNDLYYCWQGWGVNMGAGLDF